MTKEEMEKLLPAVCYTIIPGNPPGQRIGIIKRGERGYYRTDFETPRWDAKFCQEFVDEKNTIMEITKGQLIAMQIGSMCGWDALGADPRRFTTDGKPIREAAEVNARSIPAGTD